jgi:hypothetical protein
MGAPESRNLAPPVRLKAAAPSGLAWKLNRLRCMTPAEIGHRVVKAAATRVERWGFVRCEVPAPDLAAYASPWIHAEARVNPRRSSSRRTASSRVATDVFALEDVELGTPPRWNRDPKTGIEAPLDFGKELDYRDPARVGDCKYLWEPNRHLHLVTLAQAYALTAQARYADAIREHLDSWFVACPFRMGVNWSSSLEAALRLINWSAAWQLLGGVHSRAVRRARRRSLPPALARVRLPARRVRVRPSFAAFIRQQSPGGRSRGPVRGGSLVAALAAREAMALARPRDPRA